MVELSNALIVCASSPIAIKVLGPTADYLGNSIKKFAQKRIDNIARIFQQAEKKLDAHGNIKGAVSPRILKNIIDEASYIENELSAEYYSGVLASSKSKQTRDDRSIVMLKTLSTMSNYEIRMHCILYTTYRKIFFDYEKFNLLKSNEANKCLVFIPIKAMNESLATQDGEDLNQILEHAIPSLANRGLIGSTYRYGSADWMHKEYKTIKDAGVLTYPSSLGSQLYLVAHGYKDVSGNALCDSSLKIDNLDNITPSSSAFHVL